MAKVSGIELPPLPFETLTLDNGLRLRLTQLPQLQEATVSLFVRSGSRYETPATNGISHLLEHMFYRGCNRFPTAHGLNLAIEELGAELDAATHVDFASYDLELPAENLVDGIERFAAIMRAPILRDAEVEKQIIREEILEDLNEAGDQINVDNLISEMMFGDHGLGLPITGPVKNIEAFGRETLLTHFREHYCGRNAVLSIAGPFEIDQVREAVVEHFTAMPAGATTEIAAPAPRHVDRFRFVEDPGSQTDVRVSFLTHGTKHDDATAVALLAQVLDDGLSTRVHRLICEERGLAYEAFADSELYEDSGILSFGAACAHDKVPALADAMLEIVQQLQSEPVTDAELERAKRRHVWGLRAMRDSATAVNHFLGTSTLFDLQDDVIQAAEQFDSVSARDIARVAEEQLSRDRLFVACVGKQSDVGAEGVERLRTRLGLGSPSAPPRPDPTPSSRSEPSP